MKKMHSYLFPLTMMAFIFSAGMSAQETTVSVKVEKDGKVVKDTTYSFKDADQAEHALMMMDMMGSDDEHMMKVHKSMSEAHGSHSKTMVFISEDGKTTEIKEMSGDSLVWISEGEHDGDEGKRVVVVKSGDGETYDILIDEDGKDEDGNVVKTKEVKVIVTSDEEIVVKKKSKKQ
ncbi:MAG: hypothetical protein QNK35_03540 [Bacteroides sp.]|nr:hypothetical protein [Bacteroides sp.]